MTVGGSALQLFFAGVAFMTACTWALMQVTANKTILHLAACGQKGCTYRSSCGKGPGPPFLFGHANMYMFLPHCSGPGENICTTQRWLPHVRAKDTDNTCGRSGNMTVAVWKNLDTWRVSIAQNNSENMWALRKACQTVVRMA